MVYVYSDLPNTSVIASDITEPYKSISGCSLSRKTRVSLWIARDPEIYSNLVGQTGKRKSHVLRPCK